MNTTTKLLCAASIVASFSLATSFASTHTHVSKLNVENKTGEELTVIVEPGLGSVPEHKDAIKENIVNGASKNIEVSKKGDFTDSFSVTGKRHSSEESVKSAVKDAGSFIKHTCQHLKLNESYNVHFTKNSLGQIECNHTVAK